VCAGADAAVVGSVACSRVQRAGTEVDTFSLFVVCANMVKCGCDYVLLKGVSMSTLVTWHMLVWAQDGLVDVWRVVHMWDMRSLSDLNRWRATLRV
jgi:hypothetical protein